MTKKERFEKVLAYFQETNPDAGTELNYHDPYQLAVAVILSAQCTDKRVNMITPAFYQKFPTAEKLAKATRDDVFQLIKSCSYPNNKAKNLIGMAQVLIRNFNGIMPSERETLQTLPGIGRKSANVLAAVLFNKPTLAVDTHVHRVSARIGLTTGARNPYQTEMQLVKYIPAELIPAAHHWLILHGRYICKARKPLCEECGVSRLCNYFKKNQP